MSNPKDRSLAISYSVKSKPKKRMAAGGPVSAKSEARPMPDQRGSMPAVAMKAPSQDSWSDKPTMAQAMRGPKTTAIKHPRMVPSSAFTTKMRDEEDRLQSSAAVNDGPQEQPPRSDDEMRPDRQGPSVRALKMKRMAAGGQVPGAEDDMVQYPAGLESDDDMMAPSEDEILADHFADGGEVDENGYPVGSGGHKLVMPTSEQGKAVRRGLEGDPTPTPQPDYDDRHYARGGEIEEEHHDSIAAAIMAKKHRMMADGGMVDIDLNAEEQPETYDSQNEAALKENYDEDMDEVSQPKDSNEMGDSREMDSEDEHDRVSRIRSKMAVKRQFPK